MVVVFGDFVFSDLRLMRSLGPGLVVAVLLGVLVVHSRSIPKGMSPLDEDVGWLPDWSDRPFPLGKHPDRMLASVEVDPV